MSDMDNVTDFDALHKAYKKVMHGKRGKESAIKFSIDGYENLWKMRWNLRDREFEMGKYREFSVERPVHREVKTCAFEDKIVLSSLAKNVLWKKLEPHLIDDNYATREGKGTHLAIDVLERKLHNYYIKHGSNKGYSLRIDMKKYFYNLVHDIVIENMKRYGFDEWTIWAIEKVLRSSYNSEKHGYVCCDEKGRARVTICDMEGMLVIQVGSPIGNETSQIFAVEYMNPIDHFIKDQCGIKAYGRYMDDGYMIHESKEYLEWILEEIRKKSADIGIELNKHKTQIQPLENGIPFLGMHLYLTDTGKVIRRLRPSNIKYAKIHIKENADQVAKGLMTEESFWRRVACHDNHASYADAKQIRKKIKQYAEEVLKNAYLRQQRKLGDIS